MSGEKSGLCADCGGPTSSARLAVRCRSCERTRRLRESDSRFWALVDRSGGPAACWLWTGALNEHGYGRYALGSSRPYAHRHAFALTRGPIPAETDLDHLCRVRRCVNPAHLDPVSSAENTRRGAADRYTGFCRRGHPLGEASRLRRAPLRGGARTSRDCLVCHRDAEARRKSRAAA